MQHAALQFNYEESEAQYFALIKTAAKLVKRLSVSECCELLETADLPFFASGEYKAVHSLLRRPDKNKKPDRSEIVITREVYHALKKRAANTLGNRLFDKSKQFMLNHIPFVGNRVFATPQDFMQVSLIEKVSKMDAQLRFGLCFALASSATIAVMLNDLRTFDARVERINEASFWRLGKINDFMLNKKPYTKLSESEAEDAVFLQVVTLFQRMYAYKHLHPENSSIGLQDFFATAKLVAPNQLPSMELCGTLTWIYNRSVLARMFDKFEDVFFANQDKSPLAIMITNVKHIICVTFDFENNAWRLINAAPSFLVRKEFIADRVLKTFSMEDITNIALNFRFVTLEKEPREYMAAMKELRLWHKGYVQTSIGSAKLAEDCLGTTVIQVAARNGDLKCIKRLIAAADNVNAGDYLPALECAVMSNYYHIADALIKAGANINHQSDDSTLSIFARAVIIGDPQMVARFLQEETLDTAQAHKFNEQVFDSLCDVYLVPQEKRQLFLNNYRVGSNVIFAAHDLPELVDVPQLAELLTSYRRNQLTQINLL